MTLIFLLRDWKKTEFSKKGRKKTIKARPSDTKEFKEAIKKKNIRVAEEADEPIAFLCFRADMKIMYVYDKFFWIDLIYVKENQRGKGIGKRLYQDAKGIAKQKGFSRMIIDIFDANENSVGFHKKLGFRQVYGIYEKRI